MATATVMQTAPRSGWRSVGLWMSGLIAAMMLFNAWQASVDPVAFAARFGLAGAADANSGFVQVYASRALFLALATAVLLATRQWRGLMWFAIVAMVMPIADALQVASAGGPSAIVGRHIAITVYLAITAYLLHRLTRTEA